MSKDKNKQLINVYPETSLRMNAIFVSFTVWTVRTLVWNKKVVKKANTSVTNVQSLSSGNRIWLGIR